MEPKPIIEISNLTLLLAGHKGICGSERLTVSDGDIVAIDASGRMDTRELLRTLATLECPKSGRYRFDGVDVDPGDYRQCLAVKRQIGYMTAEAAMISNRTIRENLLLTRFYYENDLTIDLDETVAALCKHVGLSDQLNRRPAEVNDAALMKLIAIREMGKRPRLMLIDQPENFMGVGWDDPIFVHFKNMLQSGVAVVFFSNHRDMIGLARQQMIMSDDTIQIRSIPAAGVDSR